MGLKSDTPMAQTLATLLIKLFDFRKASPKRYKPLFFHLRNEDNNTTSRSCKVAVLWCVSGDPGAWCNPGSLSMASPCQLLRRSVPPKS